MSAYKRTMKSLGALFISMIFVFAGYALIVSSVGVILKEAGVSFFGIGLVNSCFFLGALLSTMSAHKIITKIGHIRAFGVFGSCFAICIILHSISDVIWFWTILRLVLGYCYYAFLMLIESWLNDKAKNANRSRALSLYEITFYLALGGGTLLLALNLNKYEIFIISACLIMFSSLPLNLIRIKEPILQKQSQISLPKVFDLVPLAFVTSFIAGMLLNGFFSMSSLYILLQGFEATQVSIFMFAMMLGSFSAQLGVGFISDKIGRKFAIILCASIALSAISLLFCFKLGFVVQCLLSFLLGVGIGPLYALALARANDMLEDKSKLVELNRSVLFCYSLGSLLCPTLLGALIQYFSYQGFTLFYLCALGFLILFAINKPNIRKNHD